MLEQCAPIDESFSFKRVSHTRDTIGAPTIDYEDEIQEVEYVVKS